LYAFNQRFIPGVVRELQEVITEKFAELIVRECADMAESFHRHQYDMTGNLELHEFIREHFGVEE
jgi:GTP cyclohydrolase FolE2